MTFPMTLRKSDVPLLPLWIVILALLPACTLSSAPPQVIVVTSDAPPEVQAYYATQGAITAVAFVDIPTITPNPPTATVPPTPSIPPDQLLLEGQRLRINGYYEEAIRTYQQIVDQGAAAVPEQQAEALFWIGQSAVREGLFAEAVQPLSALITTHPTSNYVAGAYFLRGDAYLGLSEWQAAIADFQQYLVLRPGFVDSYTHERIGDAQLALNQREKALESYTLAVQANRSLVPLLALREKLAQIYLAGGQYREAVAEYDAILGVAENAAYRASIQVLAGNALIEGGAGAEGYARLRQVFSESPTTADAYRAMQTLQAAGVELDLYQQGVVAFNYGDYISAVEAFNTYTTQVPLANVPPELHLYLGRAYRELGNPSAAVVAFRTIIDQYPQSSVFGDALLEQGRTLFLSGDTAAAIERYIVIANTYDYLTATAAESLWRAGYLYGTTGQSTLSWQTFETLAESYPNTEQALSGLRLGAAAAYGEGNIASAERLYARLATISTGEDRATAYFWLGQIARSRGNTQGMTTAFQEAASAAPDSFFAARAQDILNGVAAFQPPAQVNFVLDDPTERAEAEAWLRSTFGITQVGELAALSPQLSADPRLLRGLELWQLAAYSEAQTEFFELIDERNAAQDALSSYQLAVYLRAQGAYYPSIFAAANVINLAGTTTLNAPRYIAKMRYPAYYADVVTQVAATRQFDPLVMFALIRQESLFNAYATAAAGEKGLTQVIPPTGEYIAEQLQWPNYQHSDLFRPYAAIAFGGYYFGEQLRGFEGNVIAALAGYNAGPGRAIDWLALSGGDPDLFMSTITIDSTRQYVQLIYRNYNIYRALYGG